MEGTYETFQITLYQKIFKIPKTYKKYEMI